METLFKVLLILHIVGGTVGLLTGTINLIRKKGDAPHKLIGKFFAYGMLVAGLSSLLLSTLHPNYFLFIVGVFTIYLTATGYRYLYLKQLAKDQKPGVLDWSISVGMVVAGIVFFIFGSRLLITSNTFGIVLLVFGGLGLRLVKTDYDNYKGKIKVKNYWLLAHLQRMTGAYIASATAFLAVNAKYSPIDLPSFVIWLLPTAILTPLIISWSRKNKIEIKTAK